jgi:hypothetical protein
MKIEVVKKINPNNGVILLELTLKDDYTIDYEVGWKAIKDGIQVVISYDVEEMPGQWNEYKEHKDIFIANNFNLAAFMTLENHNGFVSSIIMIPRILLGEYSDYIEMKDDHKGPI